MIVVSIKYAGFIMRAHNRGDGGIMALAALLQRNRVAHGVALVTLGIFGAALFFGDGIITPVDLGPGSAPGSQGRCAGALPSGGSLIASESSSLSSSSSDAGRGRSDGCSGR